MNPERRGSLKCRNNRNQLTHTHTHARTRVANLELHNYLLTYVSRRARKLARLKMPKKLITGNKECPKFLSSQYYPQNQTEHFNHDHESPEPRTIRIFSTLLSFHSCHGFRFDKYARTEPAILYCPEEFTSEELKRSLLRGRIQKVF